MEKSLLRKLPKVDDLLKNEKIAPFFITMPREKVTDAIRTVTNLKRAQILNGEISTLCDEDIVNEILATLSVSNRKSLRPVINATGVVLHTNLGRANLSQSARDAVNSVISNYSTLEYDPQAGSRGSRHVHVEKVIQKILGVEACMVVNNNASATMLSMAAMGRGKEMIVSRGELVEIGGSFRIPDVMKESQATLVEVGTTNKTRAADYRKAITENTAAIIKVHTSNYKIIGFTEEATLGELRTLCDEADLPLIYDMGSGLMLDLHEYGVDEPNVKDAIKSGADIVLFSGDKLLGGPQAGIIVGKKEYIDRMKAHPLARVVRIDKMTIAALEATFNEYYNEETAKKNIPVLKMITMSMEEMEKKALLLKEKIDRIGVFETAVEDTTGVVGGGSAPSSVLKSVAVSITGGGFTSEKVEKLLRKGDLPIVARIKDEKVLFDIRTVFDDELDLIADKLREIAGK